MATSLRMRFGVRSRIIPTTHLPSTRRQLSKRAIASTATLSIETTTHLDSLHHRSSPVHPHPPQKPFHPIPPRPESPPIVSINATTGNLTVNFGANVGVSSFQPIWLRDHCRCAKCYHAGTKQRLLSTVEIDLDIRIQSVVMEKDAVVITWPDNHETRFDLEWLRVHSYNPSVSKSTDFIKREHKLWGSELTKNLPTVPYKDIMNSDDGLAEWLRLLDTYGIAFASGTPPTPEDTEKLGRRICFVRESHYGGFWDFTANQAHGDTAYTGLPLPAHTDTTYFTDPVGLQLFHLIEFTGTGGKSLYVDGFHVAAQLQQSHPWAYEALTRIPIPCHSAGDAHTIIAPTPRAFPILNLTHSTLHQIRFNNDDRSTLHLSAADVEVFYAALREWTRLLRGARNEVWMQLEPGMAVVLDNWRVLHGRSGFEGHRRMVGSYHNWDDYRSRVRDLCYGRLGRADL